MSSFQHIILLMWKNFIIQYRHPWVTLFEIGIPSIFVIIIAMIRLAVVPEDYPDSTVYPSFGIVNIPSFNLSFYNVSDINILYSPNTTVTNSVMRDVTQKLNNQLSNENNTLNFIGIGFSNENQLLSFYDELVNSGMSVLVLCAVIFENNAANINSELSVRIRFPFRTSLPFVDLEQWRTQFTFPLFTDPGPRAADDPYGGFPGYYRYGFLTIQHFVSMAVAHVVNGGNVSEDAFQVLAQRFPYPPFIKDNFLGALQGLLPMIFLFSFIYPTVNLVKNIVLEKEKRLKESMKMMGLKNVVHWVSWFLKTFIYLAISLVIITVFLCIKLKNDVGVLNQSDPYLVFVFFLMYSLSNICFCFLLSSLFSKANIAGIGSGVIFFACFMPYFIQLQSYSELDLAQKLLSCLLSNSGLSLGTMVISMWEGNNIGIQWSNIASAASPDDSLTLLHILVMFVVDTVLYLILTWYIENVFPGEYGIPLKWYFPLTKSYWCGHDSSERDNYYQQNGESKSTKETNDTSFEKDPNGLEVGIKIINLSKTFDRGDTYAVKDLNFTTYKGQITALLGHNGAGKTTTMSILTGLFPPSKGNALLNGFDIKTNIEKIRSSLGICPQFDVLFDDLTVEEHLKFFCKLKKFDSSLISGEITRMIQLLGLEDKRKSLSKTLSGGMKRKLSVGIALAGGSKIVILDEPTSGMDVSARRFTWDLLLQEKQDRAILLSTHFMEEADVLGDRIAIMANGELQCCGSPLFLKKKYGAGYHLTIVKRNDSTDISPITARIMFHISNAKLETCAGTEISYSLPNEESSKFEALFLELETKKSELSIDSYGVSITTMEEVFLKVGEYAEEGIKAINQSSQLAATHAYNAKITEEFSAKSQSNNAVYRNSGLGLLFQQFIGLLVKKVLFSWRNKVLTLVQIFLPFILIVVSLLVVRSSPKPQDSPNLDLNLDNFKGTDSLYFVNGNETDSIDRSLSEYYSSLFSGDNTVQNISFITSNLTNSSIDYLVSVAQNDLLSYNLHTPISIIIDNNNGTDTRNITALFNNQAYHSPAISLRYADNALMKLLTANQNYILNVANHPLPRTPADIAEQTRTMPIVQTQIANNLMFAMSFLAASFAILLVKERVTKGKHLQQVCGVKLYLFWITSYLWDFITYFISCLLVMFVFWVFEQEGFYTSDQQLNQLLLYIVHGLAMLPFVYALSYMFDTPSSAYVRITLYNIILGIATYLAVIITAIPSFNIVTVSESLDIVFTLFFPNYCLGMSYYNMYNNYVGNLICNNPNITLACNLDINLIPAAVVSCCKDKCGSNCFAWEKNYLNYNSPGIGRILLFLLIQSLFYWFVVVLIEYNVFRSIKYFFANCKSKSKTYQQFSDNITEDDDVKLEEKRMESTDLIELAKSNALIIQHLTKYYGSFCAVNDISYGVRRGECFGLLGVNGAGKTTTFKMITGDEPISNGNIYVNGFNIKKNIQKVQQQIGYCPQFDGLLDQLTGRETLTLYSRLRGIYEHDIQYEIDDISKLLYFDMHVDKLIANYSGGTKRKLSTAIALLGDPSVSFLDEPTTGVDPVARRCLWDALNKKLTLGSSIVLTSHSMEECEALCDRIIIMVNGKICCIGSPQQLKNKFGKGYTVMIKVMTAFTERRLSLISNQSLGRQRSVSDHKSHQNIKLLDDILVEQNINEVKSFMQRSFASSELKAIHNNSLHYQITDETIPWSKIFGLIEREKSKLKIEDYFIGQTNLEQIFLAFARKQRESTE